MKSLYADAPLSRARAQWWLQSLVCQAGITRGFAAACPSLCVMCYVVIVHVGLPETTLRSAGTAPGHDAEMVHGRARSPPRQP